MLIVDNMKCKRSKCIGFEYHVFGSIKCTLVREKQNSVNVQVRKVVKTLKNLEF